MKSISKDVDIFINWMLKQFGISPKFALGSALNWRINGVLITLWLRSPDYNVKIYRQGGSHTSCYPLASSDLREDINRLASSQL